MSAAKKRAVQMHIKEPKGDGKSPAGFALTKKGQKKKVWADEEILRLRGLVKHHMGKTNMWSTIAASFPGRSPHEVRQRATRDARSGTRYRRWSFIEERDLHDHVTKYGECKWALFVGASERAYNTIWAHWQTMKRRAGVASEKSIVNILDGVEEYLNQLAEKNEGKEVFE